MNTPLLFKVLGENGEAIHGGIGEWPLPSDRGPGKWLTVRGVPRCCSVGLHLVSDPLPWWRAKAVLYLAEPDLSRPFDMDGNKGAFQRARLVCEITREWPLLGMFSRIRLLLAAQARSRDKEADISWANLSGANLSRAALSGADLSWANLSGANLSRADLSGANLSRANLSGANLSGANLSRADLSGANLSGANLSRANLSWANLSWADLSRADRPTNVPPGWKADENGYLMRETP